MTAVVDLFVELARIASPPGGERAMADRVAQHARALGMTVEEDDAGTAIGGDTGNVLARLAPTAPGTPLFFCAHLDTVPEANPIEPVITGGAVRSAGDTILGADNKAAVAAMLDAARMIVAEGRPHAGVELLFTPMEEVGLRGAHAFDASRLHADAGFVYDHADAIGAYVRSAPAGFLLTVRFHGRAAHAGIAPEEGRSAVCAAADAIAALRLGRVDGDGTINIGTVNGGTAHNVVPEHCTISVDVRARTDDHARRLVDEISERCSTVAGRSGCTAEVDCHEKYRAYRFAPEDPVVALATRALHVLGREAVPVDGGGGADANVFNARGLPCLNLANGMALIHTSDEHIAVDDLEKMVAVTLALVDQASR